MLSLRTALMFFLLMATYGIGAEDAAPRPGKYIILSYGAVGKPPLVLGSLVLEKDGIYKVFLPGDKSGGEGTYTFDGKAQAVTWKTGPYVGVFDGGFSTDNDGRTHKIRLKRTTIATNSLEPAK